MQAACSVCIFVPYQQSGDGYIFFWKDVKITEGARCHRITGGVKELRSILTYILGSKSAIVDLLLPKRINQEEPYIPGYQPPYLRRGFENLLWSITRHLTLPLKAGMSSLRRRLSLSTTYLVDQWRSRSTKVYG